ncbi:hypothetical protein RISK_004489 [Rhodopirellula islandica]|uniref:Uncharacterized protein n=1 Tax=Rhodopirellula islandica TaxID=595434 RepID=A0A0J1B9R3_RHOIS|nr:hypothetical protein RISK_004489 [Rhodopirellula islandica]
MRPASLGFARPRAEEKRQLAEQRSQTSQRLRVVRVLVRVDSLIDCGR